MPHFKMLPKGVLTGKRACHKMKFVEDFEEKINAIKDSILKNTPVKYMYLFGSYAYGKPTDKSDIDIYLVLPDNTDNILEIYGRIMVDLGIKKIFFVDLLLVRESEFNSRKDEHLLERTIYQKGKMIYGY
jgi:predicted nucleotidyltransferase